jgi:hypothetical protein
MNVTREKFQIISGLVPLAVPITSLNVSVTSNFLSGQRKFPSQYGVIGPFSDAPEINAVEGRREYPFKRLRWKSFRLPYS